MISIIVPTYKEALNLEPLITKITDAMKDENKGYEIIIVDDNSCDGTIDIIQDLAEKGISVKLVTRTEERGLSSAVIKGFENAQGNILVCMDGDLSHPPECIPDMVNFLRNEKTEFVIGSRYVKGGSTDENWGLFRWLNSKVATLLARPFVKVKDPMSGFFALSKDTFERAEQLNPIGYKIALELMVKCSCDHIKEIPIHFSNRKFGNSKLNLKEQLRYIKHLKYLADFKLKKSPTKTHL